MRIGPSLAVLAGLPSLLAPPAFATCDIASIAAGAGPVMEAGEGARDCLARSATGQGVAPTADGGDATATQSDRLDFYVDPEGDDAWRGDIAEPLADLTDGPLASLSAARDAARAAGVPSRIVVRGGDYYLKEPVVFDERDAGLIVIAECGEAAVLHGGPVVTGWKQRPDGRWVAPVALGPDERVAALFVDGVAQPESRFPNAPADRDPRRGWLFAAKPAGDPWAGNTQFRFHAGDLPALGDTDGLVAHIVGGYQPGSQWGSDTLPVVAIDWKTDTITTKGTGYFFTSEGSRYFLSGVEALLDAPGEWWFDTRSASLEVIADSPSFAGANVVAGVLPTLIRLQGADDMVISGLHLRDGAPAGTGKYGTETRGFGAVRVERSSGVHLLGNVIEDVGVGIHVAESENVVIARNQIRNVAGNGIYLGTLYDSFRKSSGAQILSNHIADIGQVYFESAGIWFQAADNVRIADNLIENTAQFGIAGGSIWGAQDSVYGALIEHNEVRNANQQTADGGAIKMMGMQGDSLESTIRFNRVTGTGQLMNRPDGSFWPAGYENVSEWPTPISWAIYTDGRASGVRIEANSLVGNISAIGINGGWSNVVTGNAISGGSGAAFRIDDGTGRDWRPSWAQQNLIVGNTVSIDSRDAVVASVYFPGHGVDYVHFSDNRYCGTLADTSFQVQPIIMPSGRFGDLEELQQSGLDTGSLSIP